MKRYLGRAMPVAVTLLALVIAYWVVAFFVQRSVLFPAPSAQWAPDRDAAEAIPLPQQGGAVRALFLGPTTRNAFPAPLFIFTHGNGELAQEWIGEFAEPRAWGWAALLIEYPGYGREPGHPSEASINAVMTAAYDWARHDPRIDPSRIVAYGRSIGGGPATHLATTRPVAGLILESSFTSVARVARRFLVPWFLVRDRFDSLAALRNYRAPLLVLHGEFDEIVPFSEGKALAGAVAGAEFARMPCGHNDCPRPWTTIKAFLNAKGLMRTSS